MFLSVSSMKSVRFLNDEQRIVDSGSVGFMPKLFFSMSEGLGTPICRILPFPVVKPEAKRSNLKRGAERQQGGNGAAGKDADKESSRQTGRKVESFTRQHESQKSAWIRGSTGIALFVIHAILLIPKAPDRPCVINPDVWLHSFILSLAPVCVVIVRPVDTVHNGP